MNNKVLYIGANKHIIIDDFPDTKEFILIDTLPRSEWDDYDDYRNIEFYRKDFIKSIIKKYKRIGFIDSEPIILGPSYKYKYISLENLFNIWKDNTRVINNDINPSVITFKKNDIILKYYFSTNIHVMNKYLKADIESSHILIISGFYPDAIVFKYFWSDGLPKTLCLYSGTFIGKIKYESGNIVNQLFYKKHNFNKFIYIIKNQHIKYIFDSFYKMIIAHKLYGLKLDKLFKKTIYNKDYEDYINLHFDKNIS